MKEEKKSKSGVPIAIIVLALVVVAAVGFWFYQTSKTPASKPAAVSNTPTNSQKPAINTANAPPGAQPPNMLGSPTATVTMEEFADFQCGSCAAAYPTIKEAVSGYAGNKNFKFVFRNFPLQMHDKAMDAAIASEAAGLQGSTKFWQMQDQLFTNQHLWSTNPNYRELFAEYAQKIGLDVEKFKADMSGMQAKTRVEQDSARGKAMGISSTPSVLINGKLVPYNEVVTVAGLKRIIDAELQAAATPQQPTPASALAPQPANK